MMGANRIRRHRRRFPAEEALLDRLGRRQEQVTGDRLVGDLQAWVAAVDRRWPA